VGRTGGPQTETLERNWEGGVEKGGGDGGEGGVARDKKWAVWGTGKTVARGTVGEKRGAGEDLPYVGY